MRSVAAAIDSRSAAGMEAMIAALWAPYGDPTISVDATPARVVITWRAVRFNPTAVGYFPLGENLFQARLYPSGVIQLAYRAVPERDGIVGLFHGQSGRRPHPGHGRRRRRRCCRRCCRAGAGHHQRRRSWTTAAPCWPG